MSFLRWSLRERGVLLACVMVAASCGGGDGTGPKVLAKIVVNPNSPTIQAGGTQQFSATGQDASGSTIDVTPVWSVAAGGGTINSTSGVFTAATAAGTYTNTVVASSGSVSSSTTIVVVAAAPSALTTPTGDNQVALIGTPVSAAPSVKVVDAFGNPVTGATVTFQVTSGGGSVSGAAPVSSASGVATVGGWTLGASPGTNTLSASLAGVTGSSVSFTATAVTAAATTIAANAGNNQTAAAGSAVGTPPSVKITNAVGSPVAGVTVTFAVASGGGSVSGATSTSDASGIATVGSWTLGSSAGGNALTASAAGLTGSPITFVATGTAGAAAAIAVNAGNNQRQEPAAAVPAAPSVKVTDAHGNPVAGVAVSFAVASGGGTITGATATTNASGVAAVGSWTLGPSEGSNTLTATAAGLSGSPVTFTATAGDATPPTVVSVAVVPTTVDVTSSAQTVTFTVHATDAKSGISFLNVGFTSPLSAPTVTLLGCTTPVLASGTKADGTFSCSVTIPVHATAGAWSVTVEVDDAVGNQRVLQQSDLAAAGFPSTVTVVSR
jgi:adhesin/invasin